MICFELWGLVEHILRYHYASQWTYRVQKSIMTLLCIFLDEGYRRHAFDEDLSDEEDWGSLTQLTCTKSLARSDRNGKMLMVISSCVAARHQFGISVLWVERTKEVRKLLRLKKILWCVSRWSGVVERRNSSICGRKKFLPAVSEEKEIKLIQERKTLSAVFWDKLHANYLLQLQRSGYK